MDLLYSQVNHAHIIYFNTARKDDFQWGDGSGTHTDLLIIHYWHMSKQYILSICTYPSLLLLV